MVNTENAEEKPWVCKYRCLNCKPEDHPELMKEEEGEAEGAEDEPEVIKRTWGPSSGEESEDEGPLTTAEIRRQNKDKNIGKKKGNWFGPQPAGLGFGGTRRDVKLEPDLPIFANLGGQGQQEQPPQENNTAWKKKSYKSAVPANKEYVVNRNWCVEEEKPEPEKPRLVRPKLPNTEDFSRPILYWMQQKTLDELNEYIRKRTEEHKAAK